MTMIPLQPHVVRQRIQEISTRPTPTEFSEGKRGILVNLLNRALSQIDPGSQVDLSADNRYRVLGWLFTPDSEPYQEKHMRDLSPQNLNALWMWVQPWKDDSPGSKWDPKESFQREALLILEKANIAIEHQELLMSEHTRLPAPLPPGIEPGDTVAEAMQLPGAQLVMPEIGEITW